MRADRDGICVGTENERQGGGKQRAGQGEERRGEECDFIKYAPHSERTSKVAICTTDPVPARRRQRLLPIMPMYNVSNIPHSPPL